MSNTAVSASGFWTAVYFGGSAKFCAAKAGETIPKNKDRDILKALAGRLRALSRRSGESEKRELWYRHNELRERYPLVLADPENGWNEIITEDQLECRSELARRWEWILRREIYWGETVRDDKPMEACFELGYTHSDSEWGIDIHYHGGEHGTVYTWDSSISTLEDIEKIQIPNIVVDYGTTEEALNLAKTIFGDELEVKLRGISWNSPHMSRDLAKLLGAQEMLIKMYDEPKLIHGIMAKFLEGHLERLRFLENEGLLTLNNDNAYVGSGGIGYTRELPRREMAETESVLTGDLWLSTESQETVGVSPEMFDEFIYTYQKPLHRRFGLNCYGCCEPLDERWHIIKEIPNLRRVSVSAWADEEKMAENLGGGFIYSRKPNPADLAVPVMNETGARESIRRTLDCTKEGCIVEFVMKDNHTIGKNPGNVSRWVEIAREEIKKVYGGL